MIINYLCWSTFISLFATILLSPLRHHAQGARVTRVCAAIFLFPSLISALITQILIARTDAIFVSIARLPMVKLQFGFLLSQTNIILIISINFSLILLTFFLSRRHFVEYCSFAALTALFIFVVVATPDQLVRISAFSLGTIVLTCVLISGEVDELVVKNLTRDFILNRLSDIFAFAALIQTLSQFNYFIFNEIDIQTYKINASNSIFFFLSIALRALSLCLTSNLNVSFSTSASRLTVFYRLYIGIGSQLIFIFYTTPATHDQQQLSIFLAIGTAIFIYAVASSFFNQEKPYSVNNIATIIFAGNLLVIIADQKLVATVIMCLLITFYPSVSLLLSRRNFRNSADMPHEWPWKVPRRYLGNAFATVTQSLSLLANLFINFFSVVYAGFFFFRLPQFLLSALQLPLRFLNNGNVQRSLIFVALVLIAYSYWWGEA